MGVNKTECIIAGVERVGLKTGPQQLEQQLLFQKCLQWVLPVPSHPFDNVVPASVLSLPQVTTSHSQITFSTGISTKMEF